MKINEENGYILTLKSIKRNKKYKRNRLKGRKKSKFFFIYTFSGCIHIDLFFKKYNCK